VIDADIKRVLNFDARRLHHASCPFITAIIDLPEFSSLREAITVFGEGILVILCMQIDEILW
jgi:hypothetical protein